MVSVEGRDWLQLAGVSWGWDGLGGYPRSFRSEYSNGASAFASALFPAFAFSPTDFGSRCDSRAVADSRGTFHLFAFFPPTSTKYKIPHTSPDFDKIPHTSPDFDRILYTSPDYSK